MISILLAIHNEENYLKDAIDSVLNQSFKDFELLIGLNASTDSSKEIICSYNDDRINLFEYKEKGRAKTLNKLLKETKGDKICIQDGDDIWLSNKLQEQIKVMVEVVGSKIFYVNELGEITGSPTLFLKHQDIVDYSKNGINQIANTSAMFNKKDAIDVGGWNEDLDGIEDYDFWLKLIKKGCTFENINEELVHHRIHENSNFNTKTHDIKGLLKSHGL